MNFRNLVRQWLTVCGSSSVESSTKRRGMRRYVGIIEGLESRELLATFSVTNANDAGAGSLRQAVSQANASSGADTILISAPGEILLTSGQIEITDSVSIKGNAATTSVINAQRKSRIFDITSSTGNVALISLTLLNGRTTAADADGGAVQSVSSGTLKISKSILSGNSTVGASSCGGAISATNGTVTISQSTLTGNMTTAYGSFGGAIQTKSGGLTLSQSTLSGNSARAPGAWGGAIYAVYGSVTVSESTISKNLTWGTRGNGGGIFSIVSDIKVSQSTLSGNTVWGSAASGGAIYSYAGSLTISHSTVTQNDSINSVGGGIFCLSSPTRIVNSIVAGNTDIGMAPDISKSSTESFSVTHSLIGRNNGTGLTATVGSTPDSNGNFVGGNTEAKRIVPGLAPLADNGGSTHTHALLPNSLALNRGSNTFAVDILQAGNPALTYDQRGANFFRILSGTVDMGAVEMRTLQGSAGADTFVLKYSGSLPNGTVRVSASFNGAPLTSLGTFPMSSPLTIDGLGGTDSIRIAATSGADTLSVSSSAVVVNDSTLYLKNTEDKTLAGLTGDDTYTFDADAVLGLYTLDESAGGTDKIDFSATSQVPVSLNLGNNNTQVVHPTNLSLKLSVSSNSVVTIEDATGGAGNDTIIGNSLSNRLIGGDGNNILVGLDGRDFLEAGTGRDILIGGRGLDTLSGGTNEDILIAGRTTSDSNVSSLNTLRNVWISADTYLTRLASLRSGVGSPAVSLKAKTNVLNDAGENDILTGGAGTDWYFGAVDDVITELFFGEIIDAL